MLAETIDAGILCTTAKEKKDERLLMQIRRKDCVAPLTQSLLQLLYKISHQRKYPDVALGACGLEQAKQFQEYLTDYQISIVSKEYGNKIIYTRPEREKKIYLYMHNNHYEVITKMPGFFACS